MSKNRVIVEAVLAGQFATALGDALGMLVEEFKELPLAGHQTSEHGGRLVEKAGQG